MSIEIILDEDIKSRKTDFTLVTCCKCGNRKTHVRPSGQECWYRDYDKKGDWDGQSWLCHVCYSKKQNYLPGSHQNIQRDFARWRIGQLDKYSNKGKESIGQWVVAKVLGLKDLNIVNDRFNEPTDLSDKVEVKTKSPNYGEWSIYFGEHHNFDRAIILCMDKMWNSIERVYVIPESELCGQTGVTIVTNSIKWEDFRTDEGPYNAIFHSVNIPRFFSPIDLWKGKYDKKKENTGDL